MAALCGFFQADRCRRGGGLALAAAAGMLAGAAPARADVAGAINAGIAADDNVFRLAAGAAPPPRGCRRDTNAAVGGEAQIGLGQPLASATAIPASWSGSLKASGARTFYRCNTDLDATSGQADARLASPRIGPFTLTADASLSRRLSPFEETGSARINQQTLLRSSARLNLNITPDIAVLVQPSYLFSHNRADSFKRLDYAQFGVDAGVVYTSPLGNSIGLRARQAVTRGRYPQIATISTSDGTTSAQADLRNDARERLVELDVLYASGPFLRLMINLGYAWRRDRRDLPGILALLRSDYRGIVGSATLTLRPGERLGLDLSVSRQLASQNFLLATNARTTIYEAALRYQVGSRVELNAKTRLVDQQSRYQLLEPTPVTVANRTTAVSLGGVWSMTDRLTATLDLSHMQRLSGRLIEPFSQNAARLQVAYKMGTLAQ